MGEKIQYYLFSKNSSYLNYRYYVGTMNTSIEDCRENSIECFQNVTFFRSMEGDEPINCYTWEITYESKKLPDNTTTPIYFILDTYNHRAFSHWVYENATWIPSYIELKKQYPSMRLVIQGHKNFKDLYFEYYNVAKEDICLQSEIEPINYVFFHTYISLNDKNLPSVYFDNVTKYKEKLNTITMSKTIPLLYLPRGTKENFIGNNNRVYNVQDELKQIVKQFGGTVYETDTTTSLLQQIQIVKSACIILLDYGSNLWVNGLFAENSHIICLNIGWEHHSLFLGMGTLWDRIHQKNSLTQVFAYPSNVSNSDGLPVVCFHLNTIVNELLKSLRLLHIASEHSPSTSSNVSQLHL